MFRNEEVDILLRRIICFLVVILWNMFVKVLDFFDVGFLVVEGLSIFMFL